MEKPLYSIPENWVWTSIGEAFEVILGQSPPSETYNYDGKGLPFFQGKAEFGDRVPTIKKWCTVPKKIAEKNDVLLSVRAPVGPTNINPQRSCIGRGLAAIRPLEGINHLFVLYLIRAFENKLKMETTGTTFAAITGSRLRKIQIPLPPFSEQVRIIARVEELFSQLDAGVRSLQVAQTQLEQYKHSTLKQAYTGKLTEEWRKGEGLKLDADLEIPGDWKMVSLEEIGKFTGGGTPTKSNKQYWNNGNILWVSPKDMKEDNISNTIDKISQMGLENSSAKLVKKNSYVFSC